MAGHCGMDKRMFGWVRMKIERRIKEWILGKGIYEWIGEEVGSIRVGIFMMGDG